MFENLTNEGMLERMETDFTIFSLKRRGQHLSYKKLWQIWIREV